MRGRLTVVDDSTGSWSDPQTPFLFYPLCFEGSPTGTSACTKFGVARVAAIETSSHYYLYIELTAQSQDIPNNPGKSWIRWGIFLMRVERSSVSPYVQFGAGKAELYNADADTWHDLPYDPNYGYYTEMCDGGGRGGGSGLLNLSNFSSWAMVKGWSELGDVTYSPHDGGYILTYRNGGDPTLYYRHSTSPTFHGAATYEIDVSSLDNEGLTTIYMPSLHPVSGGEQYTMFFSDLVNGFGNSEIRAARVVHGSGGGGGGGGGGTTPPADADFFDAFNTDLWTVPGNPIQVGGVDWQGNDNFRAVDGYATGKNVAEHAIAAVPVSTAGMSEVAVDAHMRQIEAGYQTIVLSNSLQPYNTTTQEALWLQYQKDGTWYLRFRRNGGTGTLAWGSAPVGFQQQAYHDWGLVYRPDTSELEAYFEGTLLGSGDIPFTADIAYAGFQGRASGPLLNYRTIDGELDDFTVTLTEGSGGGGGGGGGGSPDFSDTFSTDYWGVPGNPIEQGGVLWHGNNNFRAVSGFATGKNVTEHAIGAIPISLSGVTEVAVELDMRQIEAGYQTIVLSNSVQPYNTTTQEALWLQYQKDGTWYLRFRRNGGTGTLASGTAPAGFQQQAYHEWRLVYEPTTRVLSAYFEGTLLSSGVVPHVPNITYAGFQARASGPSLNYRTIDGEIADFAVTLSP